MMFTCTNAPCPDKLGGEKRLQQDIEAVVTSESWGCDRREAQGRGKKDDTGHGWNRWEGRVRKIVLALASESRSGSRWDFHFYSYMLMLYVYTTLFRSP